MHTGRQLSPSGWWTMSEISIFDSNTLMHQVCSDTLLYKRQFVLYCYNKWDNLYYIVTINGLALRWSYHSTVTGHKWGLAWWSPDPPQVIFGSEYNNRQVEASTGTYLGNLNTHIANPNKYGFTSNCWLFPFPSSHFLSPNETRVHFQLEETHQTFNFCWCWLLRYECFQNCRNNV